MENTPKKIPTKTGYSISVLKTIQLAVEFAVVIIVPLFVFVPIGQWMDVKLGHEHCYDLSGIFLALILSSYIIYKRIEGIRRSLTKKPVV